MPSRVYKLPPLPSMCPQKAGNNISPAFQEAKVAYEQWVRENIFHFASMVGSAIIHVKIVLMACEGNIQGVISLCTRGGVSHDRGAPACSTCVAQSQLQRIKRDLPLHDNLDHA